MELCVALSWWPVDLMGTGKEWTVIDAFATAYVAGFPLSQEELHAIPNVLRLRDVGSLVHRMGRYFAGLETEATMQQRVEHSLWREAWLVSHSALLLHHAMTWCR
jgi:homoserine kinase type II